ncbi:MAG: DUF1971 domain-containing protein [Yokenella regensburgei]|jgi:tellurite resistance-related uncharacterized protein|uniref:Tellurite resistance protein TehB n=1 Tax=Yokenella regensburgei TaxID=158877 RepID=A0AB38FRW8_9ENTR|nr:DUF1971 domain-containing protein [Yokenella regensburgei]KAF1369165.1 tellurite resistance-related uncharacterized protein [Yokenella regensburgei]KFD20411.1 putative cytoplasmic protein [Yokenella regensburgei ATCC 49455]MDQ4427793.1 DUF1971 domain-containing protein [Yokenella regensburgei]MDR3103144.1 DUF1971 domain-containing protein [Yokenella regensburgei]QIU88802.1 DUF1971 domain-containing protein [Yokenella regensburgei]
MLRIPPDCIHTRSTPLWNNQTAPAGLFQRHLDKGTRPGVYPRLSVMKGTVKYLGYADEHSPEPVEVMVIEAGHFAVFPPEKWHHLELVGDDTWFNIDFYVAPEVLLAGSGMQQSAKAKK